MLGVSGRDDLGPSGKSAAGGEGAARRDGPCPARPAAVHALPHLQQLPDEDACPGGRFRPRLESAFGYPDGLESSRAYDELDRLVTETSRSGETVRYRYDDAYSELPATTTDATGSIRQMTWSRYGQLLAFTDCSGYQTRYEYDRFGQMTAVRERSRNAAFLY